MTTSPCLELPLVFAVKMFAEGNTLVCVTFFILMEGIKYTVSRLIQHRGACGIFPLFISNLLVRGIVVLKYSYLFIYQYYYCYYIPLVESCKIFRILVPKKNILLLVVLLCIDH